MLVLSHQKPLFRTRLHTDRPCPVARDATDDENWVLPVGAVREPPLNRALLEEAIFRGMTSEVYRMADEYVERLTALYPLLATQ